MEQKTHFVNKSISLHFSCDILLFWHHFILLQIEAFNFAIYLSQKKNFKMLKLKGEKKTEHFIEVLCLILFTVVNRCELLPLLHKIPAVQPFVHFMLLPVSIMTAKIPESTLM